MILLITSPTPIGLTAPPPLSSGIKRLESRGLMVEGSIYVEYKIFVIVASASHNFPGDCLNDFFYVDQMKGASRTSPVRGRICIAGR